MISPSVETELQYQFFCWLKFLNHTPPPWIKCFQCGIAEAGYEPESNHACNHWDTVDWLYREMLFTLYRKSKAQYPAQAYRKSAQFRKRKLFLIPSVEDYRSTQYLIQPAHLTQHHTFVTLPPFQLSSWLKDKKGCRLPQSTFPSALFQNRMPLRLMHTININNLRTT